MAVPPFTCPRDDNTDSQDDSPENSPTPDADIVEEVIVEGIRPAEMNARQIERQEYTRY